LGFFLERVLLAGVIAIAISSKLVVLACLNKREEHAKPTGEYESSSNG